MCMTNLANQLGNIKNVCDEDKTIIVSPDNVDMNIYIYFFIHGDLWKSDLCYFCILWKHLGFIFPHSHNTNLCSQIYNIVPTFFMSME